MIREFQEMNLQGIRRILCGISLIVLFFLASGFCFAVTSTSAVLYSKLVLPSHMPAPESISSGLPIYIGSIQHDPNNRMWFHVFDDQLITTVAVQDADWCIECGWYFQYGFMDCHDAIYPSVFDSFNWVREVHWEASPEGIFEPLYNGGSEAIWIAEDVTEVPVYIQATAKDYDNSNVFTPFHYLDHANDNDVTEISSIGVKSYRAEATLTTISNGNNHNTYKLTEHDSQGVAFGRNLGLQMKGRLGLPYIGNGDLDVNGEESFIGTWESSSYPSNAEWSNRYIEVETNSSNYGEGHIIEVYNEYPCTFLCSDILNVNIIFFPLLSITFSPNFGDTDPLALASMGYAFKSTQSTMNDEISESLTTSGSSLWGPKSIGLLPNRQHTLVGHPTNSLSSHFLIKGKIYIKSYAPYVSAVIAREDNNDTPPPKGDLDVTHAMMPPETLLYQE